MFFYGKCITQFTTSIDGLWKCFDSFAKVVELFPQTSADFWSLNGSSIHTGCSTGTTGGLETFDSLDLMKDEIVESTSLFGYFSLEKIDLSSLHLTSKSSFVDDRQYARSTIVLKSAFLCVRSLDDSLV